MYGPALSNPIAVCGRLVLLTILAAAACTMLGVGACDASLAVYVIDFKVDGLLRQCSTRAEADISCLNNPLRASYCTIC